MVTVSAAGGEPTLDERDAQKRASLIDDAAADPEVAAILASFPGAKITNVTLRGESDAEADTAIAGPVDDFTGDPDEFDDED